MLLLLLTMFWLIVGIIAILNVDRIEDWYNDRDD